MKVNNNTPTIQQSPICSFTRQMTVSGPPPAPGSGMNGEERKSDLLPSAVSPPQGCGEDFNFYFSSSARGGRQADTVNTGKTIHW